VLGWFVLYAYLGVPIFIVLSGFVLMLPVANTGAALELRGGFWSFMRRRWRRTTAPWHVLLVHDLFGDWIEKSTDRCGAWWRSNGRSTSSCHWSCCRCGDG
jgi:hypothetical protein